MRNPSSPVQYQETQTQKKKIHRKQIVRFLPGVLPRPRCEKGGKNGVFAPTPGENYPVPGVKKGAHRGKLTRPRCQKRCISPTPGETFPPPI